MLAACKGAKFAKVTMCMVQHAKGEHRHKVTFYQSDFDVVVFAAKNEKKGFLLGDFGGPSKVIPFHYNGCSNILPRLPKLVSDERAFYVKGSRGWLLQDKEQDDDDKTPVCHSQKPVAWFVSVITAHLDAPVQGDSDSARALILDGTSGCVLFGMCTYIDTLIHVDINTLIHVDNTYMLTHTLIH